MSNYNADYYRACVNRGNRSLDLGNEEEAILHVLSSIACSLASIADAIDEKEGIYHPDEEDY